MPPDLPSLYEAQADSIYAYHLARTGDPEAAEELTAAAFFAYQEQNEPGAPPDDRIALAGLAVSALRAYLRSGKTGARGPRSADIPRAKDASESHMWYAMSQAAAALRRKPHQQADILALHAFAGLSEDELGVLFHRSPGAIQHALADSPFPPFGTTSGQALRAEYRQALRAALLADRRGEPQRPAAPRKERKWLPDLTFWPSWVRWAPLAVGMLAAWVAFGPLMTPLVQNTSERRAATPFQTPEPGLIEAPGQNLPDQAVARLGKGFLTALDTSEDGRAAAGSSASLCLFTPQMDEVWCRWLDAAVTRVAFSPDGRRLAYGQRDGSVIVLPATGGDPLAAHSFGVTPVTGLAWIDDGLIAAASLSGEISAWEPDSDSLRWGPWRFGSRVNDLRTAALPGGNTWVAAGGDAGLAVLDGASGQPLRREAPEYSVTALAISADGPAIAAALQGPDGALVRTWTSSDLSPIKDRPLAQPAAALIFTTDQGLVSSDPSGVTLWEPSVARTHRIKSAANSPLAFDPAGERLLAAASGGALARYDPLDGYLRAGGSDDYGAPAQALFFRWGDPHLSAIDAAGYLTWWNLENPAHYAMRMPFETTPPADAGAGPTPTPGEDHFLAVDDQGYWSAWQNRGSALVTNLDSRIIAAELPPGDERVVQAAFSPSGRYLLTGDQNGLLKLWITGFASPINEIHSLSPGSTITAMAWQPFYDEYSGGDPAILAATASVRPRRVALAWEIMGRAALDLLDLDTGEVQRLPGLDRPATHLAWSWDGRVLAAGLGSGVAVWDLDGAPRLRWALPGETGSWSGALAISPNQRYVATGGQQVYLYEAGSGRLLHIYSGHTAAVTALIFDPGAARLISSDEAGISYVWQLP